MSYKVVQVNGPSGEPINVSEHIREGYTPVGGVSAAFHASENKMKYFQGMYKAAPAAVDPHAYDVTKHFGGRRTRRMR